MILRTGGQLAHQGGDGQDLVAARNVGFFTRSTISMWYLPSRCSWQMRLRLAKAVMDFGSGGDVEPKLPESVLALVSELILGSVNNARGGNSTQEARARRNAKALGVSCAGQSRLSLISASLGALCVSALRSRFIGGFVARRWRAMAWRSRWPRRPAVPVVQCFDSARQLGIKGISEHGDLAQRNSALAVHLARRRAICWRRARFSALHGFLGLAGRAGQDSSGPDINVDQFDALFREPEFADLVGMRMPRDLRTYKARLRSPPCSRLRSSSQVSMSDETPTSDCSGCCRRR